MNNISDKRLNSTTISYQRGKYRRHVLIVPVIARYVPVVKL